ncbi:MAG: hypothetical protein IJP31_10220 [Lachnospiraceae bacterium]|nr:hypothetical protein [Lachnospiraceae bacterium]
MVSVLISFIYLGMTSFLLGYGIKMAAQRFLGYSIREITGIFMAGLAAATVYAGFYSLFSGVGGGANGGLLLLCAISLFAGRRELPGFLRKKTEKLKPAAFLGLLLLILIMAYGSSRGYLHFDTGLYHAQSIRWIEEYGVVPGLGNLHSRLAYNSSAFLLTALYSGSFLTGRSLHTAAGFLALILAVKGFSVIGVWKRKKILLSDFVKVALLWYLSMIYTEMVSPASDYFAMLFLFYVVITWLELEETGEKKITPYSLLCVLLAVIVSIKLSAAVMLLLVIKPAMVLLRERRYREIAIYLVLGIVAVFPYLARNVILSGWLVYPFAGLDLFSVDWKIPIGEVQYDAEEIKVYAKGMTDVLLKDTPIRVWLPEWFGGLKGLEKLWVMASAASTVLGSLWCLVKGIKKEKEVYGIIFLELVMIIGYLFWQLGTPLVRYGYIYILAFPFLTAGLWIVSLPDKGGFIRRLMAAALVVLALYKGKNLVQDMIRFAHLDCWLWQQDYQAGAIDSYELEGITIYIPLDSGQIGYDAFPSSPYIREDIELREGTLEGGFRKKQEGAVESES